MPSCPIRKNAAEYDARGFAGVEGFSQEDLFSGINFEDIFGGLNFDFGGGNPFDGFFHRRRMPGRRAARTSRWNCHIPLERVASGGEEKVRLGRPAPCHACHGTGSEGGVAPKTCATCKGTGRITRSSRQEKEHVLIQQISTCPGLPRTRQHHRTPMPGVPRQRQ